jgi:hypothetical protein
MTEVSRLHSELVTRVIESDTNASRELRRAAFDNTGLDGPTRTLVEKVADRSYAVTDEDVATVRSGRSEDQIFELMVCAAVGAADRQYNSAMAALAEATRGGR